MNKDQRSVGAERGALVSLWGLLGLFLMKGIVGWFTGSKALLADACHSAADFANSTLVYTGLRKGRTSSSTQAQATSTITIVLSVGLLVAGLEIGISSIKSVAQGVLAAPGVGAVIAIAVGMIFRSALVRYKRRFESRCGLREDRTGENRSDIFASLTALVGAGGALVGEIYKMPFLYVLDPAAGLVIAVFVIRMGVQLTVGVMRSAKKHAIDESDSQMMFEVVHRIDGVVAVEEINAREHGHYIAVDVMISVNPRITVSEGQEIATRVRRSLLKRFLHVIDASVVVQPYDPGFPYKTNHQDLDSSLPLQ
ncbi:MAG: cation diffusion facilitator family transporter [Candidatus Cohnella colombiensis]|uniref:Cation diffusion facilitator family transporter n=1 Tax=Candidatus Cohnella colombiensis TaxID=3121368 RepID=A0AA95JDV4_9BACL|nr:MAG: cation diffusion facilitator family transporter [Cohnella sp.]